MTVTIKDVAKAANVAPSTVSRVIANSPRISEETKKRVKKVMDDLGYHPNLNARSLVSQSSQTIGIVLPSAGNIVFQNPFFSEVLRSISEGVHHRHYALQLTTGNTENEIYEDVIRMVQGRRVDGLILLYSKVDDQVSAYLEKIGFPFVLVGKPYRNINTITHVDNDNILAAKDATEYLLKLGHRDIGFIGGSKNLMVTNDRLEGYKQALKEMNLSIREEYIVHGEFLLEDGQEAVKNLLALKTPPSALLVVDDLMSVGVLRAIYDMKLNVPDDLSIISFNNALFAELSTPPLTSVDINIFALGMESVKSLIDKIENPNEPIKRIIIPHQIIERHSCNQIFVKV
ncbi:LacI family DNA-binding transcriptional regulator [Bacillus andreraoultii]|uniref:LacI family DNA-binding transcriptional regulator n=1 Tax=Bacillus andreraoultii TaxID=1499685 RepID=UPI000539E3DC|nr:LacI family DNA-binding transcriptional regulator [Bacillus andreraoultii]